MEFGIKFIQDFAIILIAASIGAKSARLLGISAIAGYVSTGLLIGTADLIFFDLTDPDRLRILSHIGIVFIMFSTGLNTRLSELRSAGPIPFLAVGITALIMLPLGRLAGGLAGLEPLESLFFTAMLMISSSVTVNRQLVELGLLHRRTGQMARSQSLLETALALGLLSVLGGPLSLAGQSDASWWQLLATLGKLLAFAILFVVAGMLLVPRILRRALPDPHGELQTIFLTGTLFALSLVAVLAGYSLALGAFLTGLITAEIPRSLAVERMFTGVRDVFRAVFFVAMGMATELQLLLDSLDLILIGTLVALGGRLIATSTAWTLVCEEPRRAVRIAMLVTPTGAFSLIIAKLGIEGGAIPESFRATAVGIVFLTGVFGTRSMRYSERVDRIAAPPALLAISEPLRLYRSLWSSLGKRGGARLLWEIARPGFWRISREFLLITAVFIFAKPLFNTLEAALAKHPNLPSWAPAALPLYWIAVASLTLPSLVALLRNLDGICFAVSEHLAKQSPLFRRLQRAHRGLLRLLAFGLVSLWIFNLVPWSRLNAPSLLLLGLLAAATLLGGWRRLVHMHRQLEHDLNGMMEPDFAHTSGALSTTQLRSARHDWKLHLREVQLPDLFFGAGRSLDELDLRRQTGASVVGIDRQGLALTGLSPQTQVFSGDTLFLLGNREQIQAAVSLLQRADSSTATGRQLHRSILESLRILQASPLIGRELGQLEWSRRFGIQVLAIRRNAIEVLNPGPHWALSADDELLLAGSEPSLKSLRQSISEDPRPRSPNPSKQNLQASPPPPHSSP